MVTLDVAAEMQAERAGRKADGEVEQRRAGWAARSDGAPCVYRRMTERFDSTRDGIRADWPDGRIFTVSVDWMRSSMARFPMVEAAGLRSVTCAALLFAEDVSHAADLGAHAAELLFEVLVAAVDVVDAVEDGFAVGDQGGEDE